MRHRRRLSFCRSWRGAVATALAVFVAVAAEAAAASDPHKSEPPTVMIAVPSPRIDSGSTLLPSPATAPVSRLHVAVPGEVLATGDSAAVVADLRLAGVSSPRQPGDTPAVVPTGAGVSFRFAAGATALSVEAEEAIRALTVQLQARPELVVDVSAVARSASDALRARRLALWRARAVRTALIAHGVSGDRIRLKAMAGDIGDGNAVRERVDVTIVAP
jgi:hypothetical protein